MNKLEKICLAYNLRVSDLFELDEYHESIIGLNEQLKIYQLLLIKVLELYNTKEKKLLKNLIERCKNKICEMPLKSCQM